MISTSITRHSIAKPLSRLIARPPRMIDQRDLRLRWVASSVSGKPASQTVQHARTNVKEEVGKSISDLARAIAGAPASIFISSQTLGNFMGITGAVAATVPQPVMVLGLAGSLPYLGSALSTVYLAHQAREAIGGSLPNIDPHMAVSLLDQSLSIQVTYGAVLLSFLGALHWGMEISSLGGQKGYRRLLLGVAPALVAWPTLALEPELALVVQWLAFTGLWYADMKVTSAGWTPVWYSQYRFYLSLVVGSCILGSLAGVSLMGPVPGEYSTIAREVEQLRSKRLLGEKGPKQGVLPPDSEFQVHDGVAENAAAYVILSKPKEGKN